MVAQIELDENTTLFKQLNGGEEGPVTLINVFHVPADVEETFLGLWQEDARFMMGHGCLSGQLYKGIEGSSSYVNVAVWESPQHMARAFGDPEFQQTIARYPESCTASPHLFKKVAVPGVCVA
ncbi:MAG: antibiotic biosynthesis monooxygenase [Actinomycetota bacterium]|nr:antibiotic biosynthesis monooxygenase [Actinomycetota bacterium]MDQ6945610.1 antibiotic biosynthesis monooxygenase [Actinomycetota bacterium]